MPIDAPIHTSEANLPRVLGAGVPVVLVFWQHDCVHCEQLAPALDRLARRYAGRALIAKVNAGEEPGLAQRHGADRLPTLVFFKEGRAVQKASGAAAEHELAAWLEYLIAGGTQPAIPSGPSTPARGGVAAGAQQPGPAGTPAQQRADAPAGQPVILTDDSFEDAIRRSSLPVLVDFWAVWCGPCKMIAPAVSDLAREFAGRAIVAKLNVDENPRTAARFGVMSIPTLLIFRDGRVVDQIVGAQPAQVLRQRLARQIV